MATLGKRKRRASLERKDEGENGTGAVSQADYNALMRKHFESTYEPLQVDQQATYAEESEDAGESEGWGGLSDSDVESEIDTTSAGPHPIEVIDHSVVIQDKDNEDLQAARKAYMTSKLPSDTAIRALRKVKSAAEDDNPTSDASLARNDLALQRLLRESKLLSSAPSTSTDSSLELFGKSRHKAMDAHLQSLGAKRSIHAQKSMPRSQRMGIVKKVVEKEATRRSDAREAGIVLEKVRKGPTDARRRERGVGAPGVGKFRGGTLTLSAKDVRQIQGPAARTKGKKGAKGRR